MVGKPEKKPKARMFAALQYFDVGSNRSLPMDDVPKGVGLSTLDALVQAGMLDQVQLRAGCQVEFRTTDAGRSVLSQGDWKALPKECRGIVIEVPDDVAEQYIAAGIGKRVDGLSLSSSPDRYLPAAPQKPAKPASERKPRSTVTNPRYRSPPTFKQTDVVRAVKAVQAAGLVVIRTEIHSDGRIVLVHHGDGTAEKEETFEEWEARTSKR